MHWTLGFGSEQDRKICVPTARKKEGWALQFPLQLSWAANIPLPVFYPLRRQGVGATVIRRRWGEGERRGSNESRKFQGMTELGVQAMTTMTHTSSPSRSPKGRRRPPEERQSLCCL